MVLEEAPANRGPVLSGVYSRSWGEPSALSSGPDHVWQSEASHLLQVIGSLCSAAGPKHCVRGRARELSRAPSWLHLSLENEDMKC